MFAADGLLNELGRLAWASARAEGGTKKSIATTLANIFCDAAARMEGMPITVEKGERWFGYMDGPIQGALTALISENGDQSGRIIENLLAAFEKVKPEITG